MSDQKKLSPEELKGAAGGYEAPEVETSDGGQKSAGVVAVTTVPTPMQMSVPSNAPTASPVVQPVVQPVVLVVGEKQD